MDERKWAGAVKEEHTGGGTGLGAEPCQREEERGGAISGATFQGLVLAQGPGRRHSQGRPQHSQHGPRSADQRGQG